MLKHGKECFILLVKCPKDADRMANSVDPHQTASLGVVLVKDQSDLPQTYLSKYSGSLR